MGNIALTILSIITARPEGEEEEGAQCDIKYLIPNTTLTNFESQKRGRGDGTVVEKIPNTLYRIDNHFDNDCKTREGVEWGCIMGYKIPNTYLPH